MFRNQQKPLLPAALVIGLAAAHAFFFKSLQDFAVFYRAGGRFLQGAPLYRLSDGVECFKYAPSVALAFSPFSFLSFRSASALWLGLTAAALILFFGFCARTFPLNHTSSMPLLRGTFGLQRESWTHLLALLLISPFLRYLLALGQCDVLLLLLLAWSEERASSRPILSGLLLAVTVLFKLPFLIFVPLLIAYREWRRATGLGAGLAIGAAVPILRYGVGGAREQFWAWRKLLAETTPPMLCHFDNQSVFGLVCRYVASPNQPLFSATVMGLGALAAGLASWAVWTVRQSDPPRARKLAFALALYLAAFLSPLGWRSNLIALLPLLYAALSLWPMLTSGTRLALLALPMANVFVGLLAYDLAGKSVFEWLMDRRLLGIFALGSAVICARVYVRAPITVTRKRKI